MLKRIAKNNMFKYMEVFPVIHSKLYHLECQLSHVNQQIANHQKFRQELIHHINSLRKNIGENTVIIHKKTLKPRLETIHEIDEAFLELESDEELSEDKLYG